MGFIRNIYFRDDIYNKLANVDNISRLINNLLEEHFDSDYDLINKKKDNLMVEIADLETKAIKLKQKEAEKQIEISRQEKINNAIKDSGFPEHTIEWISSCSSIPSILSMVEHLKSEGLDSSESERLKIKILWQTLNNLKIKEDTNG